MKKKTLFELEREIRIEAEKKIKQQIYGRRAIMILAALALLIIAAFNIYSNVNQQSQRATQLIIYGGIFIIITVADIPLRLAQLLPIHYSKKIGVSIKNTFNQLIQERRQSYPIEIEELKKSIEETKYQLKDCEKQFEEDIQADEKEIETMENEMELLVKIK